MVDRELARARARRWQPHYIAPPAAAGSHGATAIKHVSDHEHF